MLNPVLVSEDFIKSDIHMLSEQFLRGERFSLDLSEYIFKNISRTKIDNYVGYVEKIKKLLTVSRITTYYDLFIIKSNKEITEEEKTILVRYINLCHTKKNFIILFNDTIVYIPMEYIADYGKEAVHQHVNILFRQYNNKRKIKCMGRKLNLNLIKRIFH